MPSRAPLKTHAALAGFILVTLAWLAIGRPFPQDPGYHQFANKAAVFGVPNAANVLSNIPFILVGAFGLSRRQDILWMTLWAGLFLTGFGSGYYHLHPSNATLVWDRLPMSITFAAVICLFLRDALQQRASLPAWLIYSIATVLYWAAVNDLRPYVVLQFGGMLLLVGIYFTHRAALPHWGWVLLGYATAKVLEAADQSIWNATHGLLSGHAWKHLAAAAGFIPLVWGRFVSNRRPAAQTR
jgi:hypothetical protein